MRYLHSTVLIAALLLSPSMRSLQAQTSPSPFGHWQGAVSAPTGDVPIEVDLGKNPKGEPIGAFSGTSLKGFPLSNVAVNGGSVTFEIRITGGGRFEGQLSGDGKSLSGDFIGEEGNTTFSLTKSGEARIESAPRNARIRADMEGAWNGVLEADGRQLRLLLKMSNQPDGTCAASFASLDEGGLELPVAIFQEAANLRVDLKVTGLSWSGALNAGGTELVGTFTQASAVLPLTFRRNRALPDSQ